ncbi:MAG: methyltransferase domain-containing protein [Thermoleophilaceae bacterium]|jgi:SAM-dependent methyltransferase
MQASAAAYIFDQTSTFEGWADEECHRHLAALGIGPGWRCLDMGTGRDSVTRWLAERVAPSGSVVTANADNGRLEQLAAGGVSALDGLPEADFDLAFARSLLVHLPEREHALDCLIDAVRPGGWVVVADFDWTVSGPPRPDDDSRERGVRTPLHSPGLQLTHGSQLARTFAAHGLVDVDGQALIGYSRSDEVKDSRVYSFTIERLRRRIMTSGLASREDIDDLSAHLPQRDWVGVSPTIWTAWGRKPVSA